MKKVHSEIIGNQSGKAMSWAILLIASASMAYYMGGNAYLKANFKPEIALMIKICVSVICFFLFGYGLQSSLSGAGRKKGDPGFREQLSRHHHSMMKMIQENEILVSRIENKLANNQVQFSAKAIEHLTLARRIINSLGERINEIRNHLTLGANKNLIAADHLFRSKLVVSDNPMEALLDSTTIPPLTMNDCKMVLDRIITELESEYKKAA